MYSIDLVCSVLSEFSKFDRHSGIFGGYPRDLKLGKDFNDVDLYFRGPKGFNTVDYLHFIQGVLKKFHIKDYSNTGSMSSSLLPNILNTSEAIVDGVKFNFIATEDVIEPAKEFDFDICMYKFDPFSKSSVFVGGKEEPSFKTDNVVLANNLLDPKQLERSLKVHLPKLKRKFKDYTFCINKDL